MIVVRYASRGTRDRECSFCSVFQLPSALRRQLFLSVSLLLFPRRLRSLRRKNEGKTRGKPTTFTLLLFVIVLLAGSRHLVGSRADQQTAETQQKEVVLRKVFCYRLGGRSTRTHTHTARKERESSFWRETRDCNEDLEWVMVEREKRAA